MLQACLWRILNMKLSGGFSSLDQKHSKRLTKGQRNKTIFLPFAMAIKNLRRWVVNLLVQMEMRSVVKWRFNSLMRLKRGLRQETIDQVLIHDSREDGKEGKANLVDEMLEEKVNSTKGYFEESVKEKHDGNIESENEISATAFNEIMVEDSKKNKTNVEANKDEKLECSDNLEVLSLVDSGDAFMIDMGHKWMGLITVYHLIAIYNCKVVHKCKKFRLSSFPTVYEHANEIYCVKTFELKANPYDNGRNGEDTVGAPYKFMFRVQVTLGRLPMLNVKMVDIVSEHTVVITEDSVPIDLVNVIKTLDKIESCKGIKKIYKMDCTIKQELLIRRMNWWHRWEFKFTSRILSKLRSYCKYDLNIGNEAVVKGLFLSNIISTKLPFFDPFGCYMDILLGSKVNTSLASRVTNGIRILLIWCKLASLQLRKFVKGLKNGSKIFKYHMKGARVKWSFNQQLLVRGNKEELKSLIGKISEHPIGSGYKVMKMVSFM
ncbi:uncharacterized protein LOC143610622 [Bidens hawaiensis]|uniref:uncharacterized protein LOC143610622 n=1 Tax=Bidens hawaiensis TaxID=980011 RepID=UPI00404AEC9C